MAVSGVGEMGVDLSGWGIQVNRRPLNPSGLGTHSGRRGWKSIFVVGFGILPNKVVQEESLATAVIHPPFGPLYFLLEEKKDNTLCINWCSCPRWFHLYGLLPPPHWARDDHLIWKQKGSVMEYFLFLVDWWSWYEVSPFPTCKGWTSKKKEWFRVGLSWKVPSFLPEPPKSHCCYQQGR